MVFWFQYVSVEARPCFCIHSKYVFYQTRNARFYRGHNKEKKGLKNVIIKSYFLELFSSSYNGIIASVYACSEHGLFFCFAIPKVGIIVMFGFCVVWVMLSLILC